MAGTQLLLDVTSDTDIDGKGRLVVTKFTVETRGDENSIDQLTMSHPTDGDVVIEAASLEGGGAEVLVQQGKYQIVRLETRAGEVSVYKGGKFYLNYLYNGIQNKRKSAAFSIRKVGSKWQVYNAKGKMVKNLHFEVNTFVGKQIGVKQIVAK